MIQLIPRLLKWTLGFVLLSGNSPVVRRSLLSGLCQSGGSLVSQIKRQYHVILTHCLMTSRSYKCIGTGTFIMSILDIISLYWGWYLITLSCRHHIVISELVPSHLIMLISYRYTRAGTLSCRHHIVIPELVPYHFIMSTSYCYIVADTLSPYHVDIISMYQSWYLISSSCRRRIDIPELVLYHLIMLTSCQCIRADTLQPYHVDIILLYQIWYLFTLSCRHHIFIPELVLNHLILLTSYC